MAATSTLAFSTTGLTQAAGLAQRGLVRITGLFGRMGAPLGAATAAVGGLFAIITGRAAQGANALSLLSKRLGLPVEQLSALENVLAKDGISLNDFNSAISTMTQGVYDAASGAGAALVPFIRLGLPFKELINLPVADQFFAIADAIQRFTACAARTGAADSPDYAGYKNLRHCR